MATYYPLLSPSEIDRNGSAAAREVLAWVRDYLGKANGEPRLNRKYVCPFIPSALDANTVMIAVAPDVMDAVGTEQTINHFRETFHKIPPVTGVGAQSKTIIVVFPNLRDEIVDEAIDGVQRKLKASCVHDDLLMIGELHPGNMTDAAGFPNQGIYPNRTPLPVLALRVIVSPDLKKFLTPEIREDHAEEDFVLFTRNRVAYYQALLKYSHADPGSPREKEWKGHLRESRLLLKLLTER